MKNPLIPPTQFVEGRNVSKSDNRELVGDEVYESRVVMETIGRDLPHQSSSLCRLRGHSSIRIDCVMYYNNNNNITAAADEEWYLWLLTFARRRDSPLLSVPYFQQCQCRFVVKQTGIRINNKGEESGCAKKENKREHLQPFSTPTHTLG